MSARGVWIVGAGARIKDAFLPVFRALEDEFEVRGLLARSARTLETPARSYPVRTLTSLKQSDLKSGDLIVIAVSKQSVPDVLEQLTKLDVSEVDLLIDTPVVRFRLFHHWKRTLQFRAAWVAEDCADLPWIETAKRAVDAGLVGTLQEIRFEHSAYAYHAIATAKELSGQSRVRSGRRAKIGDGFVRTLRFADGVSASQSEPCRYGDGSVQLVGSAGVITDVADVAETLHLHARLDGERVIGFRVGEVETALTEAESSLSEGDPQAASVIARQSAMKRVGLFRILTRIANGHSAYSIHDGLDDMVVDYHLEKFGRYRANPFTSFDSPIARMLFGLLTRIGS